MNRSLIIALVVALALLGTASAAARLTDRYRDATRRASEAESLVASLRTQLDSTDASVVEVTRCRPRPDHSGQRRHHHQEIPRLCPRRS
jgi:peptidoglycan hydrolase CwlO-like protein